MVANPIGVAIALALAWVALVVALLVAKPKGALLREMRSGCCRIYCGCYAASPPTKACPAASGSGWRC